MACYDDVQSDEVIALAFLPFDKKKERTNCVQK